MAQLQVQSFLPGDSPEALFTDISQLLLDYPSSKKINKIFDELRYSNGIQFIDEFLQRLNITYSVDEEDVKKIPKTGAFIMVANHPFGLIDGLLTLKVIKEIRHDFKLVDEGMLQKIAGLHDELIIMHPLEKELGVPLSFGGSNQIFSSLEQGHAVGFFPSGEISSYQSSSSLVEDGVWSNQVMKIISIAEAPVLPIYFEGNNSMLFHFIGTMFSGLKNAKLPSEILNKKDSHIRIRIGTPVPVKQLRQLSPASKLARFLRAKTYGLKNLVKVKRFYLPELKKKTVEQEIMPPVDARLISKEIESLFINGKMLLQQQQFQIYLAPVNEIPNAINEIGRLREITFREVGEGTGMKLDLDEYDLYYQQLILWDAENHKIAGGYRIGLGDYIIERYGLKGFYTRSLFKMKNELLPLLQQSVELGRSYVIKEYQQKRLPLFLLWRGILTFLIQHPNYRYLFGPVSISNRYNNVSKSLIIAFIKKHYYNHEIAQYISPKKKFKPKEKQIDIDILIESADNDIKLIDKYIHDFDPDMSGTPILLKKYLNQNARIAGFNIDPQFADVLDGLMFLHLKDVPADTIKGLK
jgi:putative hemolysin